MDVNKSGDSTIIKSSDDGDTGVDANADAAVDSGSDTQEGADGVTDTNNEETGQDEPGEGGDADQDGGTEGEDADKGGGKDAGKGANEKDAPESIEAFRELLKHKEAEVERLRKETEERAKAAEAPAQMTDEQWATVEERFGGLSRTQIQPLAELVDRRANAVEKALVSRLARVEKELAISEMANQDGMRDIKSYRKEMDEFLGNYDPSTHNDPKLLRTALFYAKGVRAAAERAMPQKNERGLRVIGAGKPNTGGGSAGGSTATIKLSRVEREAAKAGGMSEREYYSLKYGGKKR